MNDEDHKVSWLSGDGAGNFTTETNISTAFIDGYGARTIDIKDFVMPNNEGSDVQCIEDVLEPTPPVVNDNCGNPITPTGPIMETIFDGCKGTASYTWNYEDCEGNNHDWVYTYTIEDTINPEIIIPTVEPLCNVEFPESLTANWTDNCSEGGQIMTYPSNIRDREDGCAQLADYVFTTPVDVCGNFDTKTLTVVREFDKYTNCETAFAKLENENARCFDNDGFSRWGWTNNITEEGTYYLPLYAGAAQCDIKTKGAHVGQVIVTYSGGMVNVEYDLSAGYVMTEAHVYIGCGKYPMKKDKATVAPGQFNFNLGSLDHVYNYSLSNVEVDGPFWIIAHAVTCEEICRCSISEDNGKQFIADSVISCETVNQTDSPKAEFKAYPVPFDETLTPDSCFISVLGIRMEFGNDIVLT